ncbi:MAG: hypothetical protein HY244_00960 [Rhizobiales bacterium]|nr:hypothetical protein [Hyphomicrobiales bacterium]
MTTPHYRNALRALLTPSEQRVFARLDTPQKIQNFLDRLPANYELDGDTAMSPRRMLRTRLGHCAEGALFAAAVLSFHGKRAWLMDIQALPSDQDHIVALFQERGLWGAISKTNHAVLRWRDPIYQSARELAMSFAHEYCLPGGKKSMLAYSRPFSLTRFAPERWVIAEDELHWLMDALDASPHVPVAPPSAMRKRRRSSRVELLAQEALEWPDPRKRKVKRKKRP